MDFECLSMKPECLSHLFYFFVAVFSNPRLFSLGSKSSLRFQCLLNLTPIFKPLSALLDVAPLEMESDLLSQWVAAGTLQCSSRTRSPIFSSLEQETKLADLSSQVAEMST